ncbi:hypothetical protein [Zavarzinella formosa]|uniref:hypothetical protein n=1 Tax=Zavarzinella formosa TaxID=360055 RepID=UPI00031E1206|nr:hypothetical protein [Zavarzinella formosa]
MTTRQLAAVLERMPNRPVKIRVENAVFEIDYVQEQAVPPKGPPIDEAEITADTFGLILPPKIAGAKLITVEA